MKIIKGFRNNCRSDLFKKWGVGLLGVFLLLLVGPNAHSEVIQPDFKKILSNTETDQEIPVIITLKDKVDLGLFRHEEKSILRSKLIKALREKADSSQARIKMLLEKKGVKEVRTLWIINGLMFKARPSTILEIANHPDVERIRLDQRQAFRDRFRGIRRQGTKDLRRKIRKTPNEIETKVSFSYSPSSVKPEWNIDLIQAPSLWKKNITGEEIVIASMDTGVDLNHADLKGKWRGGKNSWFDPHGEHDIPHDANGHGTQTMGIMVGGVAGGTAIGVAPGAKWIAVKIYNDAGQTSLGICHLGFQWLLDPDGNPETDDLPDMVNFSWGFNQYKNQCLLDFNEEIRIFKSAQVGIVFAGGNEGPHSFTSLSPANNPESISVGAIENSMHIATFSSRGPSACHEGIYPTLVAPGVIVKTTDLTFNGVFPNSTAIVTGTSFAAAHVTGAMALLKSGFPDLTLFELEIALKESAIDLGERGADHIYGYGMINLMQSYNQLLSLKKMNSR